MAEKSILSEESLREITGLPQETLAAILEIFVEAKLINKKTTGWQLNQNWSSRKARINFNVPLPTQVRVEETNTAKTILIDRSTYLQATIVRLMKASRTCKRALLVSQAIEAVQDRFKPALEDIDRAIDSLIDREFLKYEDSASSSSSSSAKKGKTSDTLIYVT